MWIDRVFYDDYEDIISVLLRDYDDDKVAMTMLTPGILYLEYCTPLYERGLLRLVAEYLS